jgi:hypothetical protein
MRMSTVSTHSAVTPRTVAGPRSESLRTPSAAILSCGPGRSPLASKAPHPRKRTGRGESLLPQGRASRAAGRAAACGPHRALRTSSFGPTAAARPASGHEHGQQDADRSPQRHEPSARSHEPSTRNRADPLAGATSAVSRWPATAGTAGNLEKGTASAGWGYQVLKGVPERPSLRERDRPLWGALPTKRR